MVPNHREGPQLLRALGRKEGMALHIGAIVGSGIFVVPATIAGHLHAMGPIVLVWVVAGVLTLCGALTVAELSAMLPEEGGPYVYLGKSFGRIWGYLFSWNDFFINKAGSAAAIAISFAMYLGHFFPAVRPEAAFFRVTYTFWGHPLTLAVGWTQVTAMVVIFGVTIINIRGTRFSGLVMDVFATAKIAALIGIVAAVLVSGQGRSANFLPWWPEVWNAKMTAAFGLAMISALWAYDGWIDVTLAAAEFRHPERDVPFALVFGSLAVIFIYVVVNLTFVYALPLAQVAGSNRVAAEVMQAAFGPVGASLVAVAIMVSCFGSTNAMLLAGPRSLFAAGADGSITSAFGRVHPQYHTPYVAIAVLGCWSAVLTLSGTYEQIGAYVVFGAWFFYALTALSVLVLRKKMPDKNRPYRAFGYPFVTLMFVAMAAWFLYNTLVEDTRNAVIGIVLLLVSLPVFWLGRRSRHAEILTDRQAR